MMDNAATQERIFAALSDPATHPGAMRIDTHAASVFLEGTRALKIKRAVLFPFLDYSTLERRKAACEEEIRINRPLAPQIYQRVVALTEGPDGTVEVGGRGKPIEYAVEMFRFDESRTLDHLAKAGPLDADLASAIADAIARSHAIATPADGNAWVSSIPALIEGNTAGLRNGNHLAAAEIEQLGRASDEAFDRIRVLLGERGRQGFVRRCHGDLHLANIVLIEQQPVLFDAVEFDAALATVDVLYDLAFTLMDLLRHDQPLAANAVLNQYLATTPLEHLDALRALPLFMSIRAAIRAQVALARLNRPHSDRPGILDDASRYFGLAQALINPPAPRLIAVGGLSGTGKSVLARALAPAVTPEPGAVVLRSDVIRKRLFGVKDADRLPPSTYQPDVTARVYETLAQHARRVLKQGHSAIVDAVFARESERDEVAALARECNVPLAGLFLVADLATRQARIGSRQRDASDATQEVAALQEHYNIGHVGWACIDASGTPEQTLQRCRRAIAEGR
ncbi:MULTISPECIES: bifunctional aminoglycoside phosphotransferase/ATP-binding protein [unclassified Bradyrhizobium]|uniref:bifunctional aminoglycoside phosphotransferase/ATP-binding protein n=1 Tax=unclassified Bradyrhizobium TaxID=2631580 RepID=UPI00247879F4|nr:MULTISPECIES: bifunctional aminoglycoside phosphotransferase/ATP-binding protein [unclassified Bradyrhizobium]WGR73716.1 AAA family ATPase [Bradyrhizobium sp. ISRA426]WGR78554.1 AAA family ATPase [Bradyrhizobium sp. ISRA430]WGR88955.1 AAA family ATPase [Bradyrhizobium sp. ISRA432]